MDQGPLLLRTPVSDLYFSKLNKDVLQQGIRYAVYTKSNQIIDPQDSRQLEIVMRSIFLTWATNQPKDVPGQVRCLNGRVLDFCVPIILREIEMYKHYINDINNLPTPLAHPQNVSNAGTRTLFRTTIG